MCTTSWLMEMVSLVKNGMETGGFHSSSLMRGSMSRMKISPDPCAQ